MIENQKFCVYLTIYSGNKLPPFYIGSTSTKNIANGYNGSVQSKAYKNIWKCERKNNKHLFRTIILYTCSSRKEATTKETKLQKQLQVTKNPLYINKSYWAGNNIIYEPDDDFKKRRSNAMKGKKLTPTHIANIQKGRIGYRHSEETRLKMSLAAKGKPKSEEFRAKCRMRSHSEETRLKMSLAAKGKPKSEAFKANLRGRKQSESTKLKRAQSNSKIWTITLPNGEDVIVNLLAQWCRNNSDFTNPIIAAQALRTKGEYLGYRCVQGIKTPPA